LAARRLSFIKIKRVELSEPRQTRSQHEHPWALLPLCSLYENELENYALFDAAAAYFCANTAVFMLKFIY
jgi:hypothetical protein